MNIYEPKITGVTLILVTLLILGCLPAAFADDIQHWHDMKLGMDIGHDISLDLFSRARWSKVVFNDHFQTCGQMSVTYSLKDQIGLTAAYRYDIADKGDYNESESRFYMEASVTDRLLYDSKLKIAFRSEIRNFDKDSPDMVRLRWSALLSHNINSLLYGLSPYIGGELFFDDIAKDINRYRFYGGLTVPITGNLSMKGGVIGQFDDGRDALYIAQTAMSYNGLKIFK